MHKMRTCQLSVTDKGWPTGAQCASRSAHFYICLPCLINAQGPTQLGQLASPLVGPAFPNLQYLELADVKLTVCQQPSYEGQ